MEILIFEKKIPFYIWQVNGSSLNNVPGLSRGIDTGDAFWSTGSGQDAHRPTCILYGRAVLQHKRILRRTSSIKVTQIYTRGDLYRQHGIHLLTRHSISWDNQTQKHDWCIFVTMSKAWVWILRFEHKAFRIWIFNMSDGKGGGNISSDDKSRQLCYTERHLYCHGYINYVTVIDSTRT